MSHVVVPHALTEVLLVRLQPGEDLLTDLEAALAEAGVRRASVVGAVASLRCLAIRNLQHVPPTGHGPIVAAMRVASVVEGPLEVVGLTGTVLPERDGPVTAHLHVLASVGDVPGVVRGGHLVPGSTVATTAEVTVLVLEGGGERVHDPRTGAAELSGWGPVASARAGRRPADHRAAGHGQHREQQPRR